jgi:hypothetical protein
VWLRRNDTCGRHRKFFRLIFSYDTLGNYYQTNFSLMQHHKYSLTELDNMLPWERQIYIDMLVMHLEEERERLKAQQRSK